MFDIQVIVGDQIFNTKLYENETTREWMRQLPMTLDMNELEAKEKYYYLPQQLPEKPQRAFEIHAGELMLFSFNCLVLFYQSFKTYHSYTPLGFIEDTRGLGKALGDKDVRVRFEAA